MTKKKQKEITAYRISWTESERGWGQRPDGYSIHASPTAAAQYLKQIYDRLPDETPDEYEFPSSGWCFTAQATPVSIPAAGLVASELTASGSARIYRSFNGMAATLYQEVAALKASGPVISINYL